MKTISNKLLLVLILCLSYGCSTVSKQIDIQLQNTRNSKIAEKIVIKQAKISLLDKDYNKAIVLWQQAVQDAQNNGYDSGIELTNLALALYHTKQYERAEQELNEAILNWESSRSNLSDLNKITLFEQRAHSYRLLQKVLIEQNRINDALLVAEKSRAQSLVERLIQRDALVKPTPSITLETIRQIAKKQKTSIVLYSLVGNEIRVLGIEENLPTEIYIWVIQPSGQIHFRSINLYQNNLQSLRQLVSHTRNEITQQAHNKVGINTYYLKKMYQLLIQPIEGFLPVDPKARVSIIPQDALFLIPFAALIDLNDRYLLQKHTLLTSPSIQILGLSHKRTNPKELLAQSPLIIGNPTMPKIPGWTNVLDSLPGSQIEAEVIAKQLNTRPLILDFASEQQVLTKISSASIIHFATHGLLDIDSSLNVYGDVIRGNQSTAKEHHLSVKPGNIVIGNNVIIGGNRAEQVLTREKVMRVELVGALALAPTNGYDGFLTSKEIVQLDLVANLVVLSACDTGQGRITGDGVVGIARSFMAAGAKTIIVSLWAIPDAPTAELMITFYQQFAKHGDKAQALRNAMLKTQQHYPHPMNWAAFILVGSPL